MAFLVITRVAVQTGSIDRLAELFDATNRDLVADEEDWLGASFTADREASEITVVARWRDADSYRALRSTPRFQATMAQFAEDFTRPPEISINEILLEM